MLKESSALGTGLMIFPGIFAPSGLLVELFGIWFLDWKEDEFLKKIEHKTAKKKHIARSVKRVNHGHIENEHKVI
jgi:hypothetical protein